MPTPAPAPPAAQAIPTKDRPREIAVTYRAQAGDPVHTRWHGFDFEHGRPTMVPAGHAMFVRGKDSAGREMPSQADSHPLFSFDGQHEPEDEDGDEEPKTAQAYFRYASNWIAQATTAGGMKSRWDHERVMREKCDWSSVDQERIDELLQPRFEQLRKAEKEVR